MFLPPEIWGCKYTNYFLFINKKPVFQHFGLLITADSLLSFIHLFLSGCCSNLTFHHHPDRHHPNRRAEFEGFLRLSV